MPTLVLDSGAECADDLFMFVRCKTRRKDGKEHRYWSVVENVRVRGGRVVQRQVLYLGEINDSQRAAWRLLFVTLFRWNLTVFDRTIPSTDCLG